MQESGGEEFWGCPVADDVSGAFLVPCSQPTPGYFTEDQTLDFLLQIQDGPGMKKVKGGSAQPERLLGRRRKLSER